MDHGPFSSMIFPLKPAFASRISKHWHQRANPIRRKFKSQLNLLNNIIEINCFCYLFKFIIHEFTYQSKIQSNKQIPVSQVNFHTYHCLGGSLHSNWTAEIPHAQADLIMTHDNVFFIKNWRTTQTKTKMSCDSSIPWPVLIYINLIPCQKTKMCC